MPRVQTTAPPETPAIATDWETLEDNKLADGKREVTHRRKVPGGWLYRASVYAGISVGPVAVSLCFVPDAAAR